MCHLYRRATLAVASTRLDRLADTQGRYWVDLQLAMTFSVTRMLSLLVKVERDRHGDLLELVLPHDTLNFAGFLAIRVQEPQAGLDRRQRCGLSHLHSEVSQL